jgi:hypothetical protein
MNIIKEINEVNRMIDRLGNKVSDIQREVQRSIDSVYLSNKGRASLADSIIITEIMIDELEFIQECIE